MECCALDNMDKLKGALLEISSRLIQTDVPWLVGGSTGLLLQGVPLSMAPRDLDLYADDQAAVQIHQLLKEYAVDEPLEDRSGLYRSILSHYLINDVKVELVGGFEVSGHGCVYKVEAAYLFGQHAVEPASEYTAKDALRTMKLMPLEHELLFNLLRDRPDRYELIAHVMRSRNRGVTQTLSDLLSRNSWSGDFVAQVKKLLTEFNQDLGKGVTGQWG